jgi:hypothetical protein
VIRALGAHGRKPSSRKLSQIVCSVLNSGDADHHRYSAATARSPGINKFDSRSIHDNCRIWPAVSCCGENGHAPPNIKILLLPLFFANALALTTFAQWPSAPGLVAMGNRVEEFYRAGKYIEARPIAEGLAATTLVRYGEGGT